MVDNVKELPKLFYDSIVEQFCKTWIASLTIHLLAGDLATFVSEIMFSVHWRSALLPYTHVFQYCVTGTESFTLGNGIHYTN